jgi:hypothetical protein
MGVQLLRRLFSEYPGTCQEFVEHCNDPVIHQTVMLIGLDRTAPRPVIPPNPS